MNRAKRAGGDEGGGHGQRVTAGQGSTNNQPVYQYGQAREEAGFSYLNQYSNDDGKGWASHFDADLTSSRSEPTQQASASNGNSLFASSWSPSGNQAKSSAASSTASPDAARRTTDSAPRQPLDQTNNKRKADRMADLVMAEALHNQAGEQARKKMRTKCIHDWQGDVEMCSCTDLNHVVE